LETKYQPAIVKLESLVYPLSYTSN